MDHLGLCAIIQLLGALLLAVSGSNCDDSVLVGICAAHGSILFVRADSGCPLFGGLVGKLLLLHDCLLELRLGAINEMAVLLLVLEGCLTDWLLISKLTRLLAGDIVGLHLDLLLWFGLRHESGRCHGVDVVHSALVTLLVQSLSLVVIVDWVLLKDLLASHVQALEEQVCLDRSDHVVFLFGDQVARLHLKVLFVLALGLLDVVSQRLLLDAGANHFLFVLSQLLIRHGRL